MLKKMKKIKKKQEKDIDKKTKGVCKCSTLNKVNICENLAR